LSGISCPRCGTENPEDAMNCGACRINLRFALENPAQIRRIRSEDASRAGDGESAAGQAGARLSNRELLPSVLLLLGAFVFAFTLGEAVREMGHFLANRAYGTQAGIVLDPFGGSHIVGGSAVAVHGRGVTAIAGPLLDLMAGLAVSVVLWRTRRPLLLPFVLWGPLALVQEGVTFSLGMLTPGGDAQRMVQSGIPGPLIVACGLAFLVLGMASVSSLLPLVGLARSDSFGTKVTVVAGGMVPFMALRALVSSTSSVAALQENLVPLVFSLLLVTLVASVYAPVYRIMRRWSQATVFPSTHPATFASLALATGMVAFQLAFFN
jgi:hypothetical protein